MPEQEVEKIYRDGVYKKLQSRFEKHGFTLTLGDAARLREIISACIEERKTIVNRMENGFDICHEAEARFFQLVYNIDFLEEVLMRTPGYDVNTVVDNGDMHDAGIIEKKYKEMIKKVNCMREESELL